MPHISNVFSKVSSLLLLGTGTLKSCMWVIWCIDRAYSPLHVGIRFLVSQLPIFLYYLFEFIVISFLLIFHFYVFGKNNIHQNSQKLQKNARSSWVDFVYTSVVSFFAREGNLDETFLDVGPFMNWGVLAPSKNERICSEYGDCVNPFYERIFSILPFNDFEMGVLKHLIFHLSQLHPAS